MPVVKIIKGVVKAATKSKKVSAAAAKKTAAAKKVAAKQDKAMASRGNVKVIKPGTKPRTPGGVKTRENRAEWDAWAMDKKKSYAQNSRKAGNVTVNNKGGISSGTAKTSKNKIKSGL